MVEGNKPDLVAGKKIYILLSQTGTVVSRLIKRVTHAEYNHASIALDKTLSPCYSFARKYKYFPIWGAFVTEAPDRGTFKRFRGTQACVLSLDVTDEQYLSIKNRLEEMYSNRKNYHYNYGGLFSAYFKKVRRKKNHYYCSEFVNELLEQSGVIPAGHLGEIVQPVDFLKLAKAQVVYRGLLRNYGENRGESEGEIILRAAEKGEANAVNPGFSS
ncbi:MAG: hypothetical protein J6Z36_00630 [Clostridia bacterium]|nr:hypothetical protein [Clostridia bacterium]